MEGFLVQFCILNFNFIKYRSLAFMIAKLISCALRTAAQET